MKILALDANVTYMNPTRNLMPVLLAQQMLDSMDLVMSPALN